MTKCQCPNKSVEHPVGKCSYPAILISDRNGLILKLCTRCDSRILGDRIIGLVEDIDWDQLWKDDVFGFIVADYYREILK